MLRNYYGSTTLKEVLKVIGMAAVFADFYFGQSLLHLNRVLTDAENLRLVRRIMIAGLTKLVDMRPRGRSFKIKIWINDNRILKIFNCRCLHQVVQMS